MEIGRSFLAREHQVVPGSHLIGIGLLSEMKRLLAISLICLALMGAETPAGQQMGSDRLNNGMFAEELLWMSISTASKYEQHIREAPASVTVITADDIERYGYRTIADVLWGVRGFYISYDRNYSYAGVRGFGRPTDYNNRILLLINGHIINDNIFSSALIGTELGLDLEAVDRIEIVRGPGSALYGTGAMFSIINVITKSGSMVNGLQLSGEGGSFGRRLGAARYGKIWDNGLDLEATAWGADVDGQELYYSEFDDPSTNNGIAEDLDWDRYHGFFTRAKYGDIDLQGFLTSREKGVPTGSWDMAFNEGDAKTLDERWFLEMKYSPRLAVDKNVMLRGYLDGYYFKAWYPSDILAMDAADGRWIGGEAQFLWNLYRRHRLTAGAEYQNHLRAEYRYWDTEEVIFDGDFPFRIVSLYAQDEFEFSRHFSFTFGLRHDDYSTVGGATTPRGAVVYHPTDNATLKLLYGEAFRAPSVYEVQYEEEGYQKRNPQLQPEKIKTGEIVWEQRWCDQIVGIVSLFQNSITDLIDWNIDPIDSLFIFDNISEAKATGIEFEMLVQMQEDFRGYVNYSYQRAVNSQTEERITNSPEHLLKIGCTGPLRRPLRAAVEIQYETERITVYETKTDPFILTHVNFSTEPLFGHLKPSLLIRNIFDVDYQLPGGLEHIQEAIAQDGRNILFRVGYDF